MDTSETYLRMADCPEIQDIRHADDCIDRDEWWKTGDFVFNKEEDYIFTVCGVRHCAADTGYFSDEDSIWLPRQEDLQAMVGNWWDALWKLWAWCDSGPKRFTSMEQLWLAFVMKERFDKQWDGTCWEVL